MKAPIEVAIERLRKVEDEARAAREELERLAGIAPANDDAELAERVAMRAARMRRARGGAR